MIDLPCGAVGREGATYGQGTDQEGCLARTLARYREEAGMKKAISSALFLDSCLEVSEATLGFCANVPLTSETVDSATWKINECARRGLEDRFCPHVLTPLQEHCESRN